MNANGDSVALLQATIRQRLDTNQTDNRGANANDHNVRINGGRHFQFLNVNNENVRQQSSQNFAHRILAVVSTASQISRIFTFHSTRANISGASAQTVNASGITSDNRRNGLLEIISNPPSEAINLVSDSLNSREINTDESSTVQKVVEVANECAVLSSADVYTSNFNDPDIIPSTSKNVESCPDVVTSSESVLSINNDDGDSNLKILSSSTATCEIQNALNKNNECALINKICTDENK
ncbi:hypothetical protein PGB90_004076 [Kerria lacca]